MQSLNLVVFYADAASDKFGICWRGKKEEEFFQSGKSRQYLSKHFILTHFALF